jgi:predicted permease
MAFQSIHAHRQGNPLPKDVAADELVPLALRRVEQSKALISFLLVMMSFFAMYFLLDPVIRPGGVTIEDAFAPFTPLPIYEAAVIGGLLLFQLSLIWTTGLQLLPTFLSSRIVQLFETLPLTEGQKDRIALYVVLRLFSYPIAVILVTVPFAVGFGLHSWVAGLAALPGAIAAVVLGLALALYTGGFFVRNVQGARGGAGRAALRWMYILLWTIPALAIYGSIIFGPGILAGFSTLSTQGTSSLWLAVSSIFPEPFSYLPVLAATPAGVPGIPFLFFPILALFYAVLLGIATVWILRAPRQIALGVARGEGPVFEVSPPLRPSRPMWAVVRKDIRTASRTPAFAFILLLPVMDAFLIGLASIAGASTSAAAFGFAAGAVTTAAGFTVVFGPAFFATELMGYAYTRSLPLRDRSLMFGKLSLIVGVYVVSVFTILGILALRLFDPVHFLEFVGAEFPAVVAAGFIELALIFHMAEKSGLPVTYLFTGSYVGLAVVIPGLFIAGIPLVGFEIVNSIPGAPSDWALPVLALLSLFVLAGAAPIALSTARGGGPP